MAFEAEGDHPLDWSHAYRDEDEIEDPIKYERYYRTVGELASDALICLSIDIDVAMHDERGWASIDTTAIEVLADLDRMAMLMVPPETVPLDSRFEASDALRALRNALPFTDAERWWLLQDGLSQTMWDKSNPQHHEAHYLDPVREVETTLVTHGSSQEVNGHDLLQRFRAWRRERGEYEDGEGLGQARDALADLMRLFRPDLDLPAEYRAIADE